MNRRRVLFYFTISFPYEEGETFINSEFPWLCKSYNKIVIITGSEQKKDIALPANVEVHRVCEITKGKSRVKYFLNRLFSIASILFSEFAHCKAKMFYLKNVRMYNSQLINSSLCADFIKNHPDFSPDASFYSFWMNDHALTLSMMKMKKEICHFVFRVHGYDLIQERWPHSFMVFQHTCHKYADRIFTVSKKSLDYFKKTYHYTEKAFYAYLGSNDQGLNPLPQGEELTVVSCSNIIPLKRIHLIIEILSQVNCKVKWVHFGEGYLNEQIKALAKQLPPNINYVFRGQVSQDELFSFYRQNPVNYFINVSDSEGLPFSIIEACSFGIPVIATDVGGTSEIVNEQTGMLVPQKFSTAIVSDYLNRSAGSPQQTSNFRTGVRKFWEQNFSSQIAYPRFISYLDKAFGLETIAATAGTQTHAESIPSSQSSGAARAQTGSVHSHSSQAKSCSRCVLNTNDTAVINFDEQGVCNYCRYYDEVTGKLGNMEQRSLWIKNKVLEIKAAGKNKKYDCILGVSGGVDSSYLSYWAKENGLRPLVVHFDNGWNSELATENIRNICEKLEFELNTYVINWEEFRELQLAYFNAGVIDIEALTDHAIMATIFQIAAKHKIKYTLNGFNFATEAIMPKGWVFDKSDWENIKDIYKKFGSGKPIRTFPHVSFYKKLFYHWFLKLQSIQVLNYINYNKEDAKKILMDKLKWRDYGGKHYESVFTKFYQSYILPVRFGVDKRKAHLSSLICSGQITRNDALKQLEIPPFSEQEIEQEKEYVLKKLNLSSAEFDRMMKQPVRKHEELRTEKRLWRQYFKLVRIAKFDFS
jgi:N-acetyl sugar amidotransferase